MKKILGALAAAAILATQVAAQPVTGRMTIHGKPVELKHAVAQPYGGPAGGAPMGYAIALTDRPLPDGALDGPEAAGVRLLAYENKVRGLLLLVDPSEPDGAVAVVLDAFGTKGLKASIIKFGEPDRQALDHLKIDARRIAARAVRDWPIDAVRFDLALDVPLRAEPPTSRDVKGREAVRATPAWQAAAAQVARMEKVTAKSVASLAAGFGPTARAQNEVVLKHFMDDRGFAELTRKSAKEMRATLDGSTRLVERGRWATVVPADPQAKPLEMVQDASGAWLLGL